MGGGGGEPSSPRGGREKEGRGGRHGRPQGIPGPQCGTNEPARPPGTRRSGLGESDRRREAARLSWPKGGRAEPPASQVAYSLSKAGLLNLQASL